MSWEIYVTDEVEGLVRELRKSDFDSYRQVVAAVQSLADSGPNLGRPL